MAAFDYINTLHTVINNFFTDVSAIGEVFDVFVKTRSIGGDIRLCDIPDLRTIKRPFSTYVGDNIYCSFGRVSGYAEKYCVRGISALVSAVNGFEITLPDWLCPDPELLENMYFYVIPDNKQFSCTGILYCGSVTSSPIFTIISKGERLEACRGSIANGSSIRITSAKWFTRGFYDYAVFLLDELSGNPTKLYSSIPQSADDMAAYRLGAFGGGIYLPRLKYRTESLFPTAAKVYLLNPVAFNDGTPDIRSMQAVFNTLKINCRSSAVLPVTDTVEASINGAFGDKYLYIPSKNPFSIQFHSRIIITSSDLMLPIVGILSKRA